MKTLKKLPFVLAFVCTLFAAGCSDIDVRPQGGGDDDDDVIIISPTPPGGGTQDSSVSMDSVSVG